MNHPRTFRAVLFRDWFLMKPWILSFSLICLAGPLLNLMAEVTTHSPGDKLSGVLQSLYNIEPITQYLGGIAIRNHDMIAAGFRPNATFHIQGGPTLSLWILAVSISLGAILPTFDRQSTAIMDTMNHPCSRQEWLKSKVLFGMTTLGAISLLRSIVIGLANAMSPLPFSSKTIMMTFVVNCSLAILSFILVFLAGLLTGNTIIAWILGFLFLNLPLCIGSIIGFYGTPGTPFAAWTYHIEHDIFLNLSPVTFTDYNTHFAEAFGVTTFRSATMTTTVANPWMIGIISILVAVIACFLANRIYMRTSAENLSNMFVSSISFHIAAISTSIVIGSVAAQIGYNARGIVWIVVSAICYTGMWQIYRKVGRRVLVGG